MEPAVSFAEPRPNTIVVLAGELSGDTLGAGLSRALRKRYPEAHFEGIGGPAMQANGVQSLLPLERLSVMGLVEVLRHLPELFAIQHALVERYRQHPPRLFIGIDAPDFNLRLARRLRHLGIPTVHYVSPSVWAWRRGRLRGIAQAVDLMLVLFPFELAIYQQANIPAHWVGHPLADELAPAANPQALMQNLALPEDRTLVALLPGSRRMEVQRLGPVFLQAAHWLWQQHPEVHFVVAAATPELADMLRTQYASMADKPPLTVITARTREVLGIAQGALVASGTATLEALLLGCPQVVAYKVAPLTAWVAKRLVDVEYFALPNLLAKAPLVEEFFQQQATPEALGAALQRLLQNSNAQTHLRQRFQELRQQLGGDANERAATAIAALLEGKT